MSENKRYYWLKLQENFFDDDTTEDKIEGVNDLPTDAVVYYSFDDVPDFPDGSYTEKKLDGNTYGVSFSGNGTVTTNPYVAGANKIHKNNVNGNLHYKSDVSVRLSRGVYKNLISYTGKIIIIDFYAYTTNMNFRIEYKPTSSSSLIYLFPLGYNISIGKHKVILFIPNEAYLYTLTIYANAVKDGYLEWELLNFYIGDGSYSTPIIDNANGENNATNNGGIAVKGVSGKCGYFLNNKYANIGNVSLAANFSISLWVKPDNNTSGLQGTLFLKTNQIILRNGTTSSDRLILHLYESATTKGKVIASLLTPNVWTNIAITRNGTALKVYLNGTLTYSETLASSDINSSDSDFTLCRSDNTRPQSIDDFQIFNRALSEEEVKAIYNNKAQTPKYYSLADYSKQGKTLETSLTIGE